MKASVFISLCMAAVLTFALPATVPAAEAAPAYDESGEETEETDESIEPGVQADDTEDEDLTKASVSETVFPCFFLI